MYLIRQGSRVCISTPAKLNLFLELHQRRTDGYHELETLMVPVDLYDSISLCPRTDGRLRLRSSWVPGTPSQAREWIPEDRRNTVYRALSLLRKETGVDLAADIEIVKRIPARAGLGGGSSDAAGALLGANIAWDLGLSKERLMTIAAAVGSDVPFFLCNSAAICTGRGELVKPFRANGRLSCVIIKPELGLSTADVFARSEVPPLPQPASAMRSAMLAMHPATIAGQLFNRLQTAAAKMTPWIQQIAQVMDGLAVCGHQMSGSGTSYFAICRNKRHARHVAAKLRAIRLGQVFVATSIGPICAR